MFDRMKTLLSDHVNPAFFPSRMIVTAKSSPHVLNPVLFALHLGIHFVATYPHIHKSQIRLEKLKWSRIVLPNAGGSAGDGIPPGHKHSFVRDGEEKETVEVWVDATKGTDDLSATIKAGLKDLLRESFITFRLLFLLDLL
jgi:urate oxidase